jgi:hypothetical protein
MKVGDMVSTRSRHFVGVIIESKEDTWAPGLNKHHVYWSSPKVEKNPVWVRECDLVEAV